MMNLKYLAGLCGNMRSFLGTFGDIRSSVTRWKDLAYTDQVKGFCQIIEGNVRGLPLFCAHFSFNRRCSFWMVLVPLPAFTHLEAFVFVMDFTAGEGFVDLFMLSNKWRSIYSSSSMTGRVLAFSAVAVLMVFSLEYSPSFYKELQTNIQDIPTTDLARVEAEQHKGVCLKW